jgi:hypothetical protein
MSKPAAAKSPKVARDKFEMLGRLESQLNLLEEHSIQAFSNGNSTYCGEVATKLRLLVVRAGQNVPLLFEVAKQFGVEITIDVPEGPVKRENDPTGVMPFERFFDKIGYMYRGENGPEYVTSSQFIRVLAEQDGGAHADWKEEAWLGPMLSFHQLVINGLPVAQNELRGLSDITIRFGRGLVDKVRSDIAAAEA